MNDATLGKWLREVLQAVRDNSYGLGPDGSTCQLCDQSAPSASAVIHYHACPLIKVEDALMSAALAEAQGEGD